MARTPSNMIQLGSFAPNFQLPATNFSGTYTYNDCRGKKGTLVSFICNHCPYVHHIIEELVRISNDYHVQGIGFVAISSNDIEKYPEDSPEKMTDFALENKIDFPYLFDQTQQVAKDYQAACTPDFFLFNSQNELVYRGQMDDSRPGNQIPINGHDLRTSIDAILYNRATIKNQKPSIGCNIKWK